METILGIALGIVVFVIEIVGIWYVNKINSQPEEDFKDWDITIADGLDELEKEENDTTRRI